MGKLWKKIIDISGWETYKASMKHRFDPEPVDAGQFNDPLARRVSWTPMEHTGLLFPRRLGQPAAHRQSFHLRRLFILATLLLPLLVGAIVHKIWFLFLPLLVVGYLLLAGMLYAASPPVSADNRQRRLCKGRGRHKVNIPFAEIHALQLLSFFYQDGHPRNAGVVYQLNLVQVDGRRVELVTQRMPPFRGSREAIIDDANRLARFLGVPLWDAIAVHDR